MLLVNNTVFIVKRKKKDFINYNNFFENNISNTNLKRTVEDLDSTVFTDGFVNKPILKLKQISHYVIDTLHLRLRITDKLVSSVFNTVISNETLTANEFFDKLNDKLKDNYCNSSIHIYEKNEFYIEYKIYTYCLQNKIKTLDIIIEYIIENFTKIPEKYLQFKHIWEVS